MLPFSLTVGSCCPLRVCQESLTYLSPGALIDPLTIADGANWRNVFIIAIAVAFTGGVVLLAPLWHSQKVSEAALGSSGARVQQKSIKWFLSELDTVGAFCPLWVWA